MLSRKQQIAELANNYGIETLLEINEIEHTYVVELLVDEGLIDLEEHFGFLKDKTYYGSEDDD